MTPISDLFGVLFGVLNPLAVGTLERVSPAATDDALEPAVSAG